jgi:hypothetical protein
MRRLRAMRKVQSEDVDASADQGTNGVVAVARWTDRRHDLCMPHLVRVRCTAMTVKAWLEMAIHDAERRGLPELKPLLEALAKATSALRTAEWNADATGEFASDADPRSPIPDPRSPIPDP